MPLVIMSGDTLFETPPPPPNVDEPSVYKIQGEQVLWDENDALAYGSYQWNETRKRYILTERFGRKELEARKALPPLPNAFIAQVFDMSNGSTSYGEPVYPSGIVLCASCEVPCFQREKCANCEKEFCPLHISHTGRLRIQNSHNALLRTYHLVDIKLCVACDDIKTPHREIKELSNTELAKILDTPRTPFTARRQPRETPSPPGEDPSPPRPENLPRIVYAEQWKAEKRTSEVLAAEDESPEPAHKMAKKSEDEEESEGSEEEEEEEEQKKKKKRVRYKGGKQSPSTFIPPGTLERFIREVCERHPSFRQRATPLYNTFGQWVRQTGLMPKAPFRQLYIDSLKNLLNPTDPDAAREEIHSQVLWVGIRLKKRHCTVCQKVSNPEEMLASDAGPLTVCGPQCAWASKREFVPLK